MTLVAIIEPMTLTFNKVIYSCSLLNFLLYTIFCESFANLMLIVFEISANVQFNSI